MASQDSSGIMAYLSRRARSLAARVLLPLAGLAVGVLAGALAWQVLKVRGLDYRAEVGLKVGPEVRAADAVESLGRRVASEDFQKAWRETVVKRFTLSGSVRLAVETVSAKDGEVQLVCLGRPRRAAIDALIAARDTLTSGREAGIEPLRSPDYAAKRTELAGQLVAQEEAIQEALRKEKVLRAAIEGDKNLAAVQADLDKTRAEIASLEKRLEAADPAGIEADRRSLLEEKARLMPAGGEPQAIDEAGRSMLREELARLEALLSEEARRDSTERHPVIQRIGEIRLRLAAADLAGKLAENDRKRKIVGELKSELLDKSISVETAKKRVANGREIGAELNRILAEKVSYSLEKERIKARMAQLDAGPALPVQVAEDGRVAAGLARDWLVWPCLAAGLLVGAVLVALIRRYAQACLLKVTDPSALAECLRLPVLGVVPALAGLPTRQELQGRKE